MANQRNDSHIGYDPSYFGPRSLGDNLKGGSKWQWFKKGLKKIGIQLLVVGLALLWLSLIAATWIEDADAAESGGNSPGIYTEDSEYNFSWLDPDKKIYVLQNRKYTKAYHPLLSVMGGVGFSNPYRNSYNLDMRLGIYISEAFGIEGFYTLTNNIENSTFKALQNASPSVWPAVRAVNGEGGLLVHWSPWYAKINVFNQILYFDWYFSGGAGILQDTLELKKNTSQQPINSTENFTAFFLGTGHQYHLSRRFIVRLDFTAAFYNALIYGDPSISGETAWYSNLNFSLGLGFRL